MRDRDRGWRSIKRRFSEAGAVVVVGFLAGKGGDREHEGAKLTMAQIAVIHEFGAPRAGIPQRPFMRQAADKDRRAWERTMDRELKRFLTPRGRSIRAVLVPVGNEMRSSVVKSITKIRKPPLATKPRPKRPGGGGGSNPLIDTGALRNAVEFDVRRADAGVLARVR